MNSSTLIHVQQSFGWFLGSFDNNKPHRHAAIQLSIPLSAPIAITTDDSTHQSKAPFLIRSNTEHKISCEKDHLVILLNPSSPQGHFWSQITNVPWLEIDHPAAMEIREAALGVWNASADREAQAKHLNNVIQQYDCFCEDYVHDGDTRIEQAIAYLNQHHARVVPVAEIADHCHLSASRFLHLFKQETGQTYRRAQLWNKLTQALPLLGKHSLTTIAHQTGFADSAHFSRTFKENFGFAPRELANVSTFIQV